MFKEQTKPFLNHKQESELREDKKMLEKMLSPNAPAHVKGAIQDVPEMHRQLRATNQQLKDDSAQAYPVEKIDAAIARENELRKKFTAGMPTQSEMRRNPPGAVDKHIQWEDRNKKAILEWKNICRRLQASDVDMGGNRSCANIEKYRTFGGVNEGNLEGGQINPTQYYLPPEIEIKNVMSDEDKIARGITPDDMKAVIAQMEALQAQIDAFDTSRETPAP